MIYTKVIEFGWVILILCPFLETQSLSHFAWFLRPMREELCREWPFIRCFGEPIVSTKEIAYSKAGNGRMWHRAVGQNETKRAKPVFLMQTDFAAESSGALNCFFCLRLPIYRHNNELLTMYWQFCLTTAKTSPRKIVISLKVAKSCAKFRYERIAEILPWVNILK